MSALAGSLAVATQDVEQGLLVGEAGQPFELRFPNPVAERPYLGQNFLLTSVVLKVRHEISFAVAQAEEGPGILQRQLSLYRGAEIVGVFELEFQMRVVAGSGGKKWVGEATISTDFTNAIDYLSGQTLSFRISGVNPGKLT